MNSKLAKFAKVAALGLALTLTLSCSSDSNGGNEPGGGTSSPSGNGDLSSSSVGDSGGGGSSSSATGGGGSSSSVGSSDVSSSSVASGGGSSSSAAGGGDGSCPTGINGTFVDTRDSKPYKWVKICDQTWLAENLNYDIPDNDTDVCYDNDPANCVTYGRLYDWATAMDIDVKYNNEELGGNDEKHQGICPASWHLPSMDEWNVLMTAVGGPAATAILIGTKLKATNGWNDYNGESGNGTDDYGFKALPRGTDSYGSGYWWSADELPRKPASSAIYFEIKNDGTAKIDASGKYNHSFSVRCVKD